MNKFFSKKNIVVILLFVIGFLPICSVSAQATMTGGGYTLNGGVTYVTNNMSGGGYTVNPSGEPLANQSEAGGYSLNPTPFTTGTSDSNNSSNNTSVQGSSAIGQSGAQSGGYTELQQNDSPSRPIFNKKQISQGVEWLDSGKGVDTNFDGVPDTFARNATQGVVPNSQNNQNGLQQVTPIIKQFKNVLNPIQVIIIVIFVIAMSFVRVVRRVSSKTTEASMGDLQVCKVSRHPIAILIDHIVLLHKNSASQGIQGRALRDGVFEKNLHMSLLQSTSFDFAFLAILDQVVVFVVTVLTIIILAPISSVLGVVIALLFALRLALGRALSK